MRIAILRRTPQASVSMDVYADAIVTALKTVHPDWEILEIAPGRPDLYSNQNSLIKGLQKYYERFWRYPQSLKSLNADIAHIIDQTDGYLVKWLQKSGIPTVVTCHDIINLVRPDWFQGKAKLPALSLATWKYSLKGMAKADHIFTVSDYTAKDLTHYLNISPQHITVTPNGVNEALTVLPNFQGRSLREHYGLTDTTCCLLNVGSNHPRKNILGILNVLASLRRQNIPVHFWKVGGNFDPEQQAFIQTHQLTPYVTYLGQPDQPTLTQIYNAADILMAPSLYEGFGLTVLEAMACGTPVVTANVSSLPEVAGDAAILVDPLDIEAMEQAVKQLYHDPSLRRSLIDRGLRRVQEFTWEKTAQKLGHIYLEVLQRAQD